MIVEDQYGNSVSISVSYPRLPTKCPNCGGFCHFILRCPLPKRISPIVFYVSLQKSNPQHSKRLRVTFQVTNSLVKVANETIDNPSPSDPNPTKTFHIYYCLGCSHFNQAQSLEYQRRVATWFLLFQPRIFSPSAASLRSTTPF